MEDYIWKTKEPLSTNTDTMNDFIDNHLESYCGEDFEIILFDGTYIEIENKDCIYGVHASGNGDFCSHRVRFELIK